MRNNFDAQKHCNFSHNAITNRTLVLLYLKLIAPNILSFNFSIISLRNLEKKQRNNLQKTIKMKQRDLRATTFTKYVIHVGRKMKI